MSKKPNLKKKLWKIFSEYIRRRDDGKCYTCSTKKDWKEMDAGHFIPAGGSNPELYFNEKNVHCQCTSCNRFKHGNLSVYAYNLTLQYGDKILDELFELKHKLVKWTPADYEAKIEYYKQLLDEMQYEKK